MLIEIYRNEVSNLYEQLLTLGCPPSRSMLDECVRGHTDSFRDRYFILQDDGDGEEYFREWETHTHGQFFEACEALKRAEAAEYKKAMQWSAV